jgi:hypothetical protein
LQAAAAVHTLYLRASCTDEVQRERESGREEEEEEAGRGAHTCSTACSRKNQLKLLMPLSALYAIVSLVLCSVQ